MEYLYLVISNLFSGVKSYSMKMAGKRASGTANALVINLTRSLICFAVSVIVWLIAGRGGTNTLGNILVLASGVGSAVNLFFWLRASGVVSLCLLEVFVMIGTVIAPILLSPILFPGEEISFCQWIGCASLFIAAIIFASQEKIFDKNNIGKKIPFIACCMCGAFLTVTSQKLFTFHILNNGLGSVAYFNLGTFTVVLFLFAMALAVAELIAYRKRKSAAITGAAESEKAYPSPLRAFPARQVLSFVLVAAISLYAFQYFNTIASVLDSAVFYPMTYSLTLMMTMLVDVLIFKVKLTTRRVVGFVFVFGAMVLVNM